MTSDETLQKEVELSDKLSPSELERLELIEDSGSRHPNDSGKLAIVWRATAKGHERRLPGL